MFKSASLVAPSSLKEIVSPILPRLDEVEARLHGVAAESDGILKESSAYVLSGGGKRLRAALVLYSASIGHPTDEVYEQAIRVACAVELIHAATLVHDDIIDHAVLRRLKPTVNIHFGSDVAVLLGDFLYAKAFEMIAGVGNSSVTERMARTTRRMCEGEMDQLRHRFRADLALEEYLSFIERKTADLISASAASGAELAGLPEPHVKALADYGLSVGIAFQIVDDLLDIVGIERKMGKTLHTDMGNGKMTLPLILLRTVLVGQEKADFIESLKSPNPDWKSAVELARRHRIQEKSEAFANDYLTGA
ncbi:MAG: hypothetical protein A2901_09000, partial [Elusimicrobia bacterium RIFCSPLOWO2_01_FULL_54_10]